MSRCPESQTSGQRVNGLLTRRRCEGTEPRLSRGDETPREALDAHDAFRGARGTQSGP